MDDLVLQRDGGKTKRRHYKWLTSEIVGTEVHCPGCQRLQMTLSTDFEGRVRGFCRHCKIGVPVGDPDQVVPEDRLSCTCGHWLAVGVINSGVLQTLCSSDRLLVLLRPSGAQLIHHERRSLTRARLEKLTREKADLVDLIEERWRLLRLDRARSSATIAVGVRFDVFRRDDFRCRYCGRGADQGVFLEADHVVPRSKGGPDTLANLVTACWDCNRGKSDKVIAS